MLLERYQIFFELSYLCPLPCILTYVYHIRRRSYNIMASLSNVAKVLLPFFSFAAIYSCWTMSFSNGTFDRISHIMDVGPQHLPNSDQPILRRLTGVKAVDDQLDVLLLFFWCTVDGTYPDLSLQASWFGGQLAAIYTVYMIESFRVGNKWRLVSLYVSPLAKSLPG